MAKATFHRHQRVFVEPVGTWAAIERVNPVWVKGFDEPVRVTYDCGLGREFAAEELIPESESSKPSGNNPHEHWRLMRARNKWQTAEECQHHPFPGTYPIIVTDANDWGGWRVPGAEYERAPHLVELQARLLAAAPHLLKLAEDLHDYARNNSDDVEIDLRVLAKRAEKLCKSVNDEPVDAPQRPRPAQNAA